MQAQIEVVKWLQDTPPYPARCNVGVATSPQQLSSLRSQKRPPLKRRGPATKALQSFRALRHQQPSFTLPVHRLVFPSAVRRQQSAPPRSQSRSRHMAPKRATQAKSASPSKKAKKADAAPEDSSSALVESLVSDKLLGQSYCEELGIDICSGSNAVFQWLACSSMFGSRLSEVMPCLMCLHTTRKELRSSCQLGYHFVHLCIGCYDACCQRLAGI